MPPPGPPLLFLLALPVAFSLPPRPVYSNHWALKVTGGAREAAELADRYGYVNLGQIGSLDGYYHFYHSKTIKRSALRSRGIHTFLRMDPKVEWVQQQEVKKRVKRHARSQPHVLYFSDLMWPSMWYLHCSDKNHSCRSEMNVLAAWQRGYTGKNVVVTILDDGVEKNHPDLMQNYDPLASYDVNGEDDDPTPRYDATNENRHGTRCAGEVAAYANNSQCIVGIAHNAKIGGIRMLDGDVTDIVEAKSLGIRPDYIDIYSVSWGPDDDGRTVDGPGPLAKAAFEQGIRKGRHSLGSIYVWASGNGGREGDYCSCDGYTNSIYTISVSSTTENGYKPWYLEECASTLATTYSSGAFYERKIITTDLRQRCTDGHTGTSASAPMVAGIIALALEANPHLTWRDVQHLIVKTSRPAHLKAPDWKINGAGHRVSHLYGFGLVDAEGMVVEAKKWKTAPAQHVCSAALDRKHRVIRAAHPIHATALTNACVDSFDQHVAYLEHVVVKISIQHPRRGDLQIYLTSPSGTKSQLLARRAYDHSTEGFKNWEFMTVHCWGEKAAGEWTLEIHDNSSHLRNPEMQGKLKEWTLILYGTAEYPYSTLSPHLSQSTVQESTMDMYASRAALYQSHLELMEEEEDYLGPCHPECGDQGCDGPGADQCLNCVHFSLGSVKTGRKCVSMCPTGFLADTVARRCKRCHKGCETCISRSHNQCTSCRKGWFLHQETNTCGTVCPAGFYADEGLKHCLKCHQNCKQCVGGVEKCIACKERFSLAGTICIQECDQNTYLSLVSMRCEACHPTCQTCTGPGNDECIYCAKDFYLHEWKCVPACSDGFYTEQVPGLPHKACRRCEGNCLSCEGSGRSCVQCKEGFSLLSGSCVTNHTCSDADEEFCEMVKYNKLCERKLFTQFCCRTCLLAG